MGYRNIIALLTCIAITILGNSEVIFAASIDYYTTLLLKTLNRAEGLHSQKHKYEVATLRCS